MDESKVIALGLEGSTQPARHRPLPREMCSHPKQPLGKGEQSRRPIHGPGQAPDQFGGRQIFPIGYQESLPGSGGVLQADLEKIAQIVQRDQAAAVDYAP